MRSVRPCKISGWSQCFTWNTSSVMCCTLNFNLNIHCTSLHSILFFSVEHLFKHTPSWTRAQAHQRPKDPTSVQRTTHPNPSPRPPPSWAVSRYLTLRGYFCYISGYIKHGKIGRFGTKPFCSEWFQNLWVPCNLIGYDHRGHCKVWSLVRDIMGVEQKLKGKIM